MTENPVPETPTPRRVTGIQMILFVSLALNLLVLGLVIGAASHMWRGPDRLADRAMRDDGFSPYVAALSPEDRRAFVRDVLGRTGDFRQNRAEMRKEIDDLLVLLRAPEFDSTAFSDSLKAQSLKLEERRLAGIEAFVARVAEMSSEAREELAARIAAGMHRPRN